MKTEIDKITVRYFDDLHRECAGTENPALTRLSVWVDTKKDNYHVEFRSNVNRFELSGILINLAHSIVKGVKTKEK